MKDAKFQFIFDGPALSENTIDVRNLAPALISLGHTLEAANEILNSNRAKVALRVHASFKSGCFGIDFSVVQGILDQALSLFKETPIVSAKELIEILGFVSVSATASAHGLVQFITWLRNRKIKEVLPIGNEQFKVIVDDDQYEAEKRTIELFRSYRVRQELQKVFYDPLVEVGFDSIAIKSNKLNEFVCITKEESRFFVAPKQEEEFLSETVEERNLQLVSVVFKGDNKWRFSDGNSTFYATITDNLFNNKVLNSEISFRSGDILFVRMRIRQTLSGETIKSEYEIEKILDHRSGVAQLRLPFNVD